MKARVNSRQNTYKPNIKEKHSHKIKMQRDSRCKKEHAIGYCISHSMYVALWYANDIKGGRCFNCEKFIDLRKGKRNENNTKRKI